MDNNKEIENTLSYGEVTHYKQDEVLKFQDFSIIYKGIFDVKQDGLAISLQTTDFLIIDNGKNEQLIKIGNGQLPNPPRDFSVGEHNFTIWTYANPDGETLEENTLIITKK